MCYILKVIGVITVGNIKLVVSCENVKWLRNGSDVVLFNEILENGLYGKMKVCFNKSSDIHVYLYMYT